MKMSIAIDGPAGAGKSTIAKMIGDKYELMYINTGSMYRAVTLFAMRNNINEDDIDRLCALIETLDMRFEKDNLIVNGEDITEEIRSLEVTNNVSKYASVAEVRKKLVDMQRKIADNYNVIMDGRDIGTVVLKDATIKVFLTARAEERAKRRYKELMDKNVETKYEDILSDIERRDYIDSNREVDPLKKSDDAIEIDSSLMNIEEVVNEISKLVESTMK
ncbi:MAG: (d)CMP kinase [Clostridium sp.]|nr:(d)CMP kinase [Clostridium sp.]